MNALNDIVADTLYAFSPAWPLLLSAVLMSLVFIGLAPWQAESDMSSREVIKLFIRRALYGSVVFLGIWALFVYLMVKGGWYTTPLGYWDRWFDTWPYVIFLSTAIAVLGKFIGNRFLAPYFSSFFRDLRVTQSSDKLSDIKTEIDAFSDVKKYEPHKFHKDGEIFAGLRAGVNGNLPIYIDWDTFYETNKAVVGATRYGKGVTYQVTAQQQIRNGDCLFLIDPKGDRFLPKVLQQECEAAGRKFIALDLHQDGQGGAWAPFVGGDKRDKFARFCEINQLREKGAESDHYKVTSRSAFSKIFEKLGPDTHLKKILKEVKAANYDEDLEKAMSTEVARLEEWAQRQTLAPHPKKVSFSIERALLTNAVVYVKGSIDDEITKKATQAFIIEVLQETKRLQDQRTSHMSLYVDELRFMVSKSLLAGLATIVGYNASMFLAFQNFGDLLTPDDQSLDGRGIDQSVKVNCQIKCIFGGTDFKTAEYVSENSGTTTKDVTRAEGVMVNEGGGEVWEGGRQINTVEEAFITPNKIMSLPALTGILFRPNKLAVPICVAPVLVKEKEAA